MTCHEHTAQTVGARPSCAATDLPGSAEYGLPDLRRMHVGRHRVLYEITDVSVTIVVIHVGRLS
ncbi:type II toxin-antitoxin system RelE/ParE family toxin [Streptomyces sp. NBC_01341]|uniref:type II toxin-antitoxin system RelE family toxin n=1 Tax=Streptomyces sp. NBC_01341 TaxID=2903831 RepID=UPI002E0DE319|nr:type II toxin-antitoxin system RelE/ParE family toxin [Streptomyces sp. NBC_01341]